MKNLYIVLILYLAIMSSCQKEDFLPKESLNGEVTASNATSANDVLETALPINNKRQIEINSNVSGYYEILPARYSITTKRYPLIIFIHGIGELGTGLSRLTCCGIPYHAARGQFPPKFYVDGKYYSYIVIAPQFRVRPAAWHIQSVIDYVKNKYRIDHARIYVTGLSMGGGSTWDWSVVYGKTAAAIGPVSAGAKPTTTLASNVATKNLPIWSLNSNDDQYIPIQWAKDWINWIDARNTTYAPKTKLTIWYGLTHNSTWRKAFDPTTKVDGYSLYQWFLRYTRSTNILPVSRAGSDVSIALSWNYMPTLNGTTSSDADGWIKAFRWTKISGPSSYYISTPYAGKTKVTGLVAGTYVFRLTVTDNLGATDIDDVVVYVRSS